MPAQEAPPPHCLKWMPAPAPDPVFSFVQTAVALESLAVSPEMHVSHFPATVESLSVRSLVSIPAAFVRAIQAPAPEPVSAFVACAVDLEPLAFAAKRTQILPEFSIQAELEPLTVPGQPIKIPAACERTMRAPDAEPVWAFVRPAVEFAFAVAPAAVQLPRFTAELETPPILDEPMQTPPACETWMRSPEAEPVWAFVQPAVELAAMAPVPMALRLPRFAGELEAFPVLDQSVQPPAERQGWMLVPRPEPVFTFVRAAAADTAGAWIAASAPEGLEMAGPHIPSVATFRAIPPAEPVMAGVWPHVADIPFEPIYSPAAVKFPGIATLSLDSALRVPPAESGAPPATAEPAESFVFASQIATLLPTAMPDFALPEVVETVLLVGNSAPQLAGAVAGPAPAALESLLAASSADQLKSATVVRLQPFAVAASEERTVPGFDAPRLAPPVSQPRAAAAKVVVMPIQTIQVAAPQPPSYRPTPSIPLPGTMPLEFHAQRLRGDAVTKLDWRNSRFAPIPPSFSLRSVWERNEDVVAQKPVPKKSTVAEVFALPEAKPRPKYSKWVGYVAKIAAGIVIVMVTWYGAGSIQEHSLQGRTNISKSMPSDAQSGSAGSRTALARAERAAPSGAIARVRQTIASRAAVQYGDNLREGMEAWGAAAKTYPAGWSRSAEGYVNTGALALFTPTRNFTDYQLEFLGQIENKSMGWTVRAKDANNYHAMKFTVIESGLRPVIAMVHYNVIDGKAGYRSQTPLNVMVHNRTPIQVAVNVKGNHLITSIDGEEVDSYSDDALSSGGVGFFSEANEKARLYWVKVSKNDDWLGHVCAFLSGVDAAPAISEMWPPELPGAPKPWSPDGERASLASAWIALPYFRASRRARSVKSRRYQEWNT